MVADGSQSGYVRAATSELHGNERSPSSSLSGVMGVLRRRRRLRLSRQTAPAPNQSFAPVNALAKLSPQSGATDIRRSAMTSARSGPSTSSANSRIRFRSSIMRGVGSGCVAQASSDGHWAYAK